MKNTEFLNISLRQIQIFLKCYEYRNYTRVAEYYNFTPSMISKTIHNLEEDLELKLFDKSYHLLIPTPAADTLAKAWSNISNEITDSIEQARSADENQTAKIRIGLLETSSFCENYVLTKLEEHASSNLLKSIQWEKRDMHALPKALLDDQFDLIITWSGEEQFLQGKGCKWKTIFSSPDAIFLSREHPLFNKQDLTFKDLEPYSFLALSPATYPHYYQYLLNICQKFGFKPKISTICGSTESARYNLNLGKGIYIAPSLICSDWENEDLRKAELDFETDSKLIIAWKEKSLNADIQKIIDIVAH